MTTQTLPELITRLGDEEAALLLDSKETVVKSWRLRQRYPRRETAKKIITILSRHPLGPIDWAGIYGD